MVPTNACSECGAIGDIITTVHSRLYRFLNESQCQNQYWAGRPAHRQQSCMQILRFWTRHGCADRVICHTRNRVLGTALKHGLRTMSSLTINHQFGHAGTIDFSRGLQALGLRTRSLADSNPRERSALANYSVRREIHCRMVLFELRYLSCIEK